MNGDYESVPSVMRGPSLNQRVVPSQECHQLLVAIEP